jgi:23S rRNA pseudouridine2605 synthase
VRVNGRVVREPGTQVDPGKDEVRVHGRPLPGAPRLVYLMLHKPVGVLTTLDDPEGRRTVRQFVPPGPRLFPVGRLDADTSGLLLLTNDGELAHKLMHPRYGVSKVYRVRLGAPPAADQVRRLREGVAIEPGQVTSPAEVRVRNARPGRSEIEIVLHEGRYRQVRRMCEAVGLTVTALHRAAYGPLRLGALARGEVRALTAFEVAKLREESARPGGVRARLENTRRRLAARATRPDEAPPAESTGWPAGPAFEGPPRARAGRYPGERASDRTGARASPAFSRPGRSDRRGSRGGGSGYPASSGGRRGRPMGRDDAPFGSGRARGRRTGMGQTPVPSGQGRARGRPARRAGTGASRGLPGRRRGRRFSG